MMDEEENQTNINLKIILSLKICIQSFNENMNFFFIKNRIEIMRNYNVLFINLFFNIKKVIIFKKKIETYFSNLSTAKKLNQIINS